MQRFLLATALLATSAYGQTLSYKGLALGTPRADVLEKFPSMQCAKPPPQFRTLGDEHCTARRDCAPGACTDSLRELGTYAGVPALDVTFSVVAGRIEGVTTRINDTSYETVRDALRAALGPGREDTQAMQTLGGAQLAPRVWEFESADGAVTLFERAGRVNTGVLRLQSKAFDQWQRKPKPGGKDL